MNILMMNILIRTAKPEDNDQTEAVVRVAFWDVYRPGAIEHLVLHKLRVADAIVDGLDLVAWDGEKIVGVLVCPEGSIQNGCRQRTPALSMMVGVLPAYQGQGIGTLLIRRAIEVAKARSYRGMVIFGDPGYYARFGFKNAAEYGIQTSEGQNLDPFMALELCPGGLRDVHGRFIEHPAFQP
jgi:predicted N-acetyltransferase YhbS